MITVDPARCNDLVALAFLSSDAKVRATCWWALDIVRQVCNANDAEAQAAKVTPAPAPPPRPRPGPDPPAPPPDPPKRRAISSWWPGSIV